MAQDTSNRSFEFTIDDSQNETMPLKDFEKDLSDTMARPESITRGLVKQSVTLIQYSLRRLPIRMSLSNLGLMAIALAIVLPRTLTYVLLYPIFRLVFGNLYPAYASYKAVRTKNVKEYVKWMMYWIVFALFTCAETFTDVFFSFWFPFYYEFKMILVVWLLSPATKGSSILYRRFVHPALIRREAEIDEALARATEQGYTAVLHLGTKGVNYATTVLMQTAIKGGGGLVQHLKKSYSLSDLTGEKEDENRNTPNTHDETDMEVEPRRREHVGRRGYSPRRTQSSSTRVEMYFPEVDVDVRQPRSREPTSSLTSSDDISSGYSSGEVLQSHRGSQGDSLVRTASVGARTRAKPRTTTKKTPEDPGEDSDNIDLPPSTNISFPSPLSHITPEQALELLLLLKQNSNVNENISLDRGCLLIGNDSIGHTGQLGPNSETIEMDTTKRSTEFNDSALGKNDGKLSESLETSNKLTDSPTLLEAQVLESKIETIELEGTYKKGTSESSETLVTTDDSLSRSLDHKEISNELCENKFDELKHLLNEAHKAVSNIVQANEQVRPENSTLITEVTNCSLIDVEPIEIAGAVSDTITKVEDVTLVDDKSCDKKDYLEADLASTSRSSSDSLNRAGKYHKKPAPKAPMEKSEDDLDDAGSQNALKATLVIKTGTLKTFSNSTTTKDVFLATDKSKSKKSKRQRTKEGFSKLLTIPKNIFHNAFYREQKEPNKTDDSGSIVSEISDSGSRSNSIASQEMIVEHLPKFSASNQEETDENALSKSHDVDDDIKEVATVVETSENSESNIVASGDNKVECNDANDTAEKGEDAKTENEIVAKLMIDHAVEKGTDDQLEIKEMSQSPKVMKKIESDIY